MGSLANLSEPVPLRVLAADGRTDLFPQVRIYNSSGLQVATFDAVHIAEGLYGSSWTPGLEGFFTLVAQFYFDNLHTVDAGYEKTAEDMEVSSLKTNILRILGLHHENAVIDSQAYDVNGHLSTARVRTYDSKANAQAAGVAGLLANYTVTAAYDLQGRLINYTMVRDA